MNTPTFFGIATAVFAAALLSSCGTAQFDRDWKEAVSAYEAKGKSNDPVAGPWTGNWRSEANAHNGPLRCLVSPSDSSQDLYEFRYHAVWGEIFKGGYTAEYAVKPDGKGGLQVSGSKDLGPFGHFDHEGTIKGNSFDSTYSSSKGDRGFFELKRP